MTSVFQPIIANRFSLRFEGVELAAFSEVESIVEEVEQAGYWVTTSKGVTASTQPGELKPLTVTLQRGLTGGAELWAWHDAVRKGQAATALRTCQLVMYDSAGQALVKYLLTNAWPSKLELSGVTASTGETLVETVTLVADSIERQAP